VLEGQASDRIEVRRHDLLSDPLSADAFDLVHARLLLMHLPSRLEALRRPVSAVRAGGWLAAIDPDFTTVALSPTTPTRERTWSVFCDALIAGGWDPRYGALASAATYGQQASLRSRPTTSQAATQAAQLSRACCR
jgi:hypothetical protein